MSAGQRYLSPAEIGAIYGVTGKTVLDWYHQGRIPAAVATGRIYRFDREKVERALAAEARERVAGGMERAMVPVL